MSKKRSIDICVVSDTHLGTYGAHAEELLAYLKSIKPRKLILNGDIVDMWQFKKRYFPTSHTAVLRQIIKMIEKGTRVYYITGNHDDALRQYSPMKLSNFELVDKVILTIDGKKYWFFHGDVFDRSIQQARWVARLGSHGYDFLIRFNRLINSWLIWTGKHPISLSKRIKANIKNAVKYISDFEQVAIDLAIKQGYDYVVCGHIHQSAIRQSTSAEGSTIYMNSGDWVESLTSLEYVDGQWKIYHHEQAKTKIKSAKLKVSARRDVPSKKPKMVSITNDDLSALSEHVKY